MQIWFHQLCIQVRFENKNGNYEAALLMIFFSLWSGEYIVYLPQACLGASEIMCASLCGSKPHWSSIKELGKWAKPLSCKLALSWTRFFFKSWEESLAVIPGGWAQCNWLDVGILHMSLFSFYPEKHPPLPYYCFSHLCCFTYLYRWTANRLDSELLEGLGKDFLYICVHGTMLDTSWNSQIIFVWVKKVN